jgi:hypothetical protein
MDNTKGIPKMSEAKMTSKRYAKDSQEQRETNKV